MADSVESILKRAICEDYTTADKVGRNYVGLYTISTCSTVICGYETAIWYYDYFKNMVIVERYSNRQAAEQGHKKWVEFCKNNPKSAWSVQLDEECCFF